MFDKAIGWIPKRNEYFAALAAACCVNGLLIWVLEKHSNSWIWYFGLFLALRALVLAPDAPFRRADFFVGGFALLMLLWPLSEPSWLALTVIATYLLFTEQKGQGLYAGAAISLALTVTPLWGRLFPLFLSGPIEQIDMWAVSGLTGSDMHGNRLDFVHGDGGIVVMWGCTSFANASLALLLWVALTRTFRPMPKRGEWMNLAAVFAAVFTINTIRLTLMAQSLRLYELAHGPIGAFWTNVLLLVSTCACCAFGLRRELAR